MLEERAGFEPAIPVTWDNRFRGGRFRPLSHLSKNTLIFNDYKNLEQSINKSMSFKYALFALPEEIGLFLTRRIGKD